MDSIKFGTSGWRAIVAEDFTVQNVRIVCQGIAQYLRQQKIGQQGMLIGYDARFLGERFAKVVAEVMAAHGIPCLLCDRDTPTPTISYHVINRKLAGGINISASHNPPEWNGIKFTPDWGGPALPETTKAIELRILPLLHGEHLKWLSWERAQSDGMVRYFDPQPDYLKALEKLVDRDRIRNGQIRVIFDPLFGTTRNYLDEFLRGAGAKMAILHHWRDPHFGGFRSSSLGPIGAVAQTSASWAVIHQQYDAYDMSTIFILGCVLGAARIQTRSILLPFGMHALINLIATTEAAIL